VGRRKQRVTRDRRAEDESDPDKIVPVVDAFKQPVTLRSSSAATWKSDENASHRHGSVD
jgi:hypothetical protein